LAFGQQAQPAVGAAAPAVSALPLLLAPCSPRPLAFDPKAQLAGPPLMPVSSPCLPPSCCRHRGFDRPSLRQRRDAAGLIVRRCGSAGTPRRAGAVITWSLLRAQSSAFCCSRQRSQSAPGAHSRYQETPLRRCRSQRRWRVRQAHPHSSRCLPGSSCSMATLQLGWLRGPVARSRLLIPPRQARRYCCALPGGARQGCMNPDAAHAASQAEGANPAA
jgi:hypothetical protein